MPYLVVCPLSQLENQAAIHRPSHVLSLLSPDMAAQTPMGVKPADHMTLSFHDISAARDGLHAAQISDIDKLLKFATSDWPGTSPLLIHCWFGVSRSTASAYAIACALKQRLDEASLAIELRRIAPFATPNPRVTALADNALNRGGRMTKAIEDIGRGRDCSEGTPFVWKLD